MKKLYFLLITVVVISACGKERDDNTTCTCTNSDFEVVGTYTGLTESECAAKETGDVTCILE